MSTPWVQPVHAQPVDRDGLFVVTRYADVMATQRRPDIAVKDLWPAVLRIGERAGRDYAALAGLTRAMMFNPNEADHSVFRQIAKQALGQFAPAFAPATVAETIRAALADARARGRVEAMETLCRAIPTSLMTNALGLRAETMATIGLGAAGVFKIFGPSQPLRALDQINAQATRAKIAIAHEIARARRDPSMGLARIVELSAGRFDDSALAENVFFFTLAGIETITGLFGSLLLMLLTHADQWRAIAANPELIGSCVEEVIRIAGPMRRLAPRVALETIELGGATIPAGAILVPELEQAHHDPAVFAQPDRFDVARAGPPNMGFGLGAHACLGAALGRLQGRLFVQALLDEGPIRLVDPEPAWEDHVSFRRLKRLDLEFA